MIAAEKLLTPPQVAELLSISESKVWLLSKGGELPGIRVGRSWRYRRADLDAYLDQHLAGGPQLRLGSPQVGNGEG